MEPHILLDLPPNPDAKAVLQAVARAMRERRYAARDIAEAQKALLNPTRKAVHVLNAVDFSPVMHLCTVTPPHADVSLDDLDHICDPASL